MYTSKCVHVFQKKEGTENLCMTPSSLFKPPVFYLSPTGCHMSGTTRLLEGASTPAESPSAEVQIPDR